MKTIKGCLVAAAALAIGLSGPTMAQDKFPEHELTMIVNYGAGGATDLSARAVAAAMEEELGVPVTVVNRAGGGGTVGPTVLSGSKSDGYTFGVTSFSPMAIQPAMREVPYTLDDFTVLGATGRYRYGLAVQADSGIETLDDLIAKAKESKVTVSASGPPNNLVMSQLTNETGGKFNWIPYGSGTDSVVALLSGEVDATVQNPNDILPHETDGKLRFIASVSPVRWFERPDVPTLEELGYDISIDSYVGFSAPAGIPEENAAILENALMKALESETVQNQFRRLGMEPTPMSGAEYEVFLREGQVSMREQLKASGLIE